MQQLETGLEIVLGEGLAEERCPLNIGRVVVLALADLQRCITGAIAGKRHAGEVLQRYRQRAGNAEGCRVEELSAADQVKGVVRAADVEVQHFGRTDDPGIVDDAHAPGLELGNPCAADFIVRVARVGIGNVIDSAPVKTDVHLVVVVKLVVDARRQRMVVNGRPIIQGQIIVGVWRCGR